MESIGNATDAAFIYNWVKANKTPGASRTSERMQQNPPEGWTFLGEGSYRSTWGKDGVAYKVEHRDGDYGQDNSSEYRNLKRAWECDPIEGVRLPRGDLYTLPSGRTVMAMECIAGKTVNDNWDYYWNVPDHISYLMDKVGSHFNLSDIHSENVMIDAETEELVPVDFGW